MTDDDETIAKTLWSETILEILYTSLKKNKSDTEIIELLKEIRGKGFKRAYIIEKTEKIVDKQAAMRVRGLLK